MNAPFPQTIALETLAAAYLEAKEAETKAVARRRELGDSLAKLLKSADEGTVSTIAGDLKISVAYKLTRKVDTKALVAAWDNLPPNVRAAFRWDAEVEMKHFRALEDAAPADYAAVLPYITTKSAAPTITVELKKD